MNIQQAKALRAGTELICIQLPHDAGGYRYGLNLGSKMVVSQAWTHRDSGHCVTLKTDRGSHVLCIDLDMEDNPRLKWFKIVGNSPIDRFIKFVKGD